MFTRVLVPLDGTTQAAAALPVAATLARATGASITLLRVTTHHGHERAADAPGNLGVEDEVRAAADTLARSGLPVDWLIRTAPVAEAIVQAADQSHSDVIVMATHGRSGPARAFAGSVSERVVADAGCLVLLLHPDSRRLDQIGTLLVPVDGTAGGALALGATVGLARATGARLVLLDIVPPTPLWMSGDAGFGYTPYVDPAWEEEALRSATTYVDGVASRLQQTGLQVTGKALRGEVAPTIHAIAEELDVDLVVMSTHALTGPARAVLGSVADAVVRTGHRPVLLVRRPGGASDGLPDPLLPASEVGRLSVVGG